MMVADVSYLDNLTEKLGRQRLDDGFSHAGAGESLHRTQPVPDFHLTPRQKALLICKPRDLDFSLGKDSSKPGLYSRGFLRLETGACSKSAFVTETSVRRNKLAPMKRFAASKRSFLRCDSPDITRQTYTSEAAAVSRELDSDSGNLSSSSDDELRELFIRSTNQFKTKPREGIKSEKTRSDPALSSAQSPGISFSANMDVNEKDNSRKRNKTTRGNLKKRQKFSRPSLNLEKMLAARIGKELGNNRPESSFFPIHEK